MSGHVFISHGSENRDDANQLCAFIEGRGVKVWIAPRDVRPGMDYSEQLQEAIEGCVAFVVLVTAMANKSPYVRAETEMAFSGGKPIFPVRLSDIKPAAGLAFFLKIRHWTDAFGPGRDASLDRLARELQNLSGVAPAASAAPPPPAAAPTPAPIPAPALAAAAAPSRPPDEELLRAAIGPKADYYIARWREVDEKAARTSWNWAACFLSIFWMAYRKMWLPMVVFLVANVVLGVLGSAGPAMARITLFASIGLTFVTGWFGNLWYRKQIAALIAQTAGLDREAALARLRDRGGVSVAALVVSLVVAGLLVLLAGLGAVMQAQQQLELQRQQQLQEQQRQQELQLQQQQQQDLQPAEQEAPPPAEEF